jgi:spectinomycin phosphotransferase
MVQGVNILLEKPDLEDSKIVSCLHAAYGLDVDEITFLPLGNDVNTAVYRAVSHDAAPYFVKLRSGEFDDVIAAIPKLLHDQGISQVIAPLTTQSGALWTLVDGFKLTLYPFVEGRNGYKVKMTDEQWAELGHTLKAIHTVNVPPALESRIPHETYGAYWRDTVKGFQRQAEAMTFTDPISAALADLLKAQQAVVNTLVRRAERLGAVLQARLLPLVLCHADIHAANVLIDASGKLYIVDWDTLVFAPKERDLMFPGGGQYSGDHTAAEEETLFYRGYGQTDIDYAALAYYRYERIVEDVASYCQEIWSTEGDGQDRARGLRILSGQFMPDGVIHDAYSTEKHLPPELQGL